MSHQLSSEDRSFKRHFEACIISPSDFSHRAHIRLAYIYLCENETGAAFHIMRDSLQAFLNHYDVDPSKYHETMTRAWIMAVKHFMVNSTPASSADDFIERNSRLLNGKIMLTHYSEEVLFSENARLSFIEPDLDAIPQYT